jgi:DNA repair exonuclease SbcCD nuclease subunit
MDFFANYQRVLDAAAREPVDFVVHGGDFFYRSRIPASVAVPAYEPLKRIADTGIPVFLVPGNHERSRLPFPLLLEHPRIHVFHRPMTFVERCGGPRVAFTGFPYHRRHIRTRFRELLGATGWQEREADIRLLCVHHCFEGATVGPADYTFRYAEDVIRVREVPASFDAVLTGHVHRHQALTADLRGHPLPTPILYPGSIERTSFAEKDEAKGYLVVRIPWGEAPVGDTAGMDGMDGGEEDWERSGRRGLPHVAGSGSSSARWEFRELPTRPMVVSDLDGAGRGPADLESMVRAAIRQVPADAVLRLRIRGRPREGAWKTLSAPNLRAVAPATMNVEAVFPDHRRSGPSRRAATS